MPNLEELGVSTEEVDDILGSDDLLLLSAIQDDSTGAKPEINRHGSLAGLREEARNLLNSDPIDMEDSNDFGNNTYDKELGKILSSGLNLDQDDSQTDCPKMLLNNSDEDNIMNSVEGILNFSESDKNDDITTSNLLTSIIEETKDKEVFQKQSEESNDNDILNSNDDSDSKDSMVDTKIENVVIEEPLKSFKSRSL